MYGEKPKSGTAGFLAFLVSALFVLGLIVVGIIIFTDDVSTTPQTEKIPSAPGEIEKSTSIPAPVAKQQDTRSKNLFKDIGPGEEHEFFTENRPFRWHTSGNCLIQMRMNDGLGRSVESPAFGWSNDGLKIYLPWTYDQQRETRSVAVKVEPGKCAVRFVIEFTDK